MLIRLRYVHMGYLKLCIEHQMVLSYDVRLFVKEKEFEQKGSKIRQTVSRPKIAKKTVAVLSLSLSMDKRYLRSI